jgi:dienelactone hydrolase
MAALVPLDYNDGAVALRGVLALPEGDGPHPAVLVIHDALGLGELARERAAALADLGYVALAGDMYGGGVVCETSAEAGTHMAPLDADPAKLRARAGAGLAALAARAEVDPGRIAAIGFCFGGQCALELARTGADLKAVVSFHGLLTTHRPAAPGAIRGEVAVFTGSKDPFAPPAHIAALRDEMTAAGARWQLTEYGEGYHAFTDARAAAKVRRDGLRYDPLLDALSWSSTLTLLNATLH